MRTTPPTVSSDRSERSGDGRRPAAPARSSIEAARARARRIAEFVRSRVGRHGRWADAGRLAAAPRTADETTIGREWEENPFVVVWRGAEPEGTEPVRVGGEDATLVVWSPDYDGKGKAWVRFADGRDAIVGGSRVERG